MIQGYHMTRVAGDRHLLLLPRAAGRLLPAGLEGSLLLSHGSRRVVAEVRVEKAAAGARGDQIGASPPVLDSLGLLPDLIPYRVRWRDGELCFGPVIGILAGLSSDRLDLSPGGYARQFLLRYPAVGGLVYLFGALDIDFEREEIDGWCWVPEEGQDPEGGSEVALSPDWERARRLSKAVVRRAREETEPETPNPRTARFEAMAREFLEQTPFPPPRGRWSGSAALGTGRFMRGRFPFPAAIWRRSDLLGKRETARLAARIGPRIFNSSFFNKEEGYRILSADPTIRPHLPETQSFRGISDLLERVGSEGAAILKRQAGNSGYGLIRVDADGEGYRLRVRERIGPGEQVADSEALQSRLAAALSGGEYLLQQCIRLPEYRGRLNDYRVMMQKDGAGRWVVRAMLGRFGARESIVTNFVNSGYALPAEEAVRRAFGIEYREAHRLSQSMADFALAVGGALDRTGGCYGDLGLDIALDRGRRLWLFEVNKLPFLELPLLMGDEQTYLEVKSGGLPFAAYLAGFEERGP